MSKQTPLAEQRRIVVKDGELMAVLAALGVHLAAARTTTAHRLATTIAGLNSA
jgi:hypothetical protein